MSRNNPYADAICDAYAVPDYIHACANACRYDLMHGPSFVRIPWGNVENFTDDDLATFYDDVADECEDACGDVIEETYTGRVGDALRAFIDSLPSDLWVDVDCDCVMTSEPDQFEANPDYDSDDEDSGPEYFECDLSNVWHVERREIIESLFGRTIAKEFY